jgi:hypothetical protein
MRSDVRGTFGDDRAAELANEVNHGSLGSLRHCGRR